MTTADYAKTYIDAINQGYCSIDQLLNPNTGCKTCPAADTCSALSNNGTYLDFLENFEPIYKYIQLYYPEYCI